MVRPFVALLALLLVGTSFPAAPLAAAPTSQTAANLPSSIAYFAETGHSIGGEIKQFFDANGGLAAFGLPLSELFLRSDGMRVQYFERARFEYRPELPVSRRVSLSRLGGMIAGPRLGEQPFQWLSASPDPSRDFYPESGHTLGGAFRWHWQTTGGLALYGFPISEEFVERSVLDGQEYLVQYFERARFEYHPERAGTADEVMVAQLGRELLGQDSEAAPFVAPRGAPILLGEAATGFASSSSERVTNISRATEMATGRALAPNEEHSFISIGDFSEANGFVDGYAIVGGRLERVIGGGLCQVSTTLFRAASNAGLAITRRIGHSHIVSFYENIIGFDATVFTPSVDFRWRNDSASTIYLVGITDVARGRLTFQIYGAPTGRSVSYEGPTYRNWREPGRAAWQYDPSLPAGAVRQLVNGRRGVDVSYTRIIREANGSVRRNTYQTFYKPWEDFFIYGPGVTPPAGVQVLPPRSSR